MILSGLYHPSFTVSQSIFIRLVRRHLLGIISLVLFAGAVIFWIWPPQGAGYQQLEAACWRVGALTSISWLAYSDLRRLPAWCWAVLLGVLIVVALRPRLFLLAVPVIVALAILRPRIGKSR